MIASSRIALVVVLFFSVTSTQASEAADCTAIENDIARLQCYDAFFASSGLVNPQSALENFKDLVEFAIPETRKNGLQVFESEFIPSWREVERMGQNFWAQLSKTIGYFDDRKGWVPGTARGSFPLVGEELVVRDCVLHHAKHYLIPSVGGQNKLDVLSSRQERSVFVEYIRVPLDQVDLAKSQMQETRLGPRVFFATPIVLTRDGVIEREYWAFRHWDGPELGFVEYRWDKPSDVPIDLSTESYEGLVPPGEWYLVEKKPGERSISGSFGEAYPEDGKEIWSAFLGLANSCQ